jgi:hypothetical protein
MHRTVAIIGLVAFFLLFNLATLTLYYLLLPLLPSRTLDYLLLPLLPPFSFFPFLLFLKIVEVVVKQLRHRRKTNAVQYTHKIANQPVLEAIADHEGYEGTTEEEPSIELPCVESSSEAMSLTDHHVVTPTGTGEGVVMKVKRSPMKVYRDLDGLLNGDLAGPERQLVFLCRLMMSYLLGAVGYEDLKELSEEYIGQLKLARSSAIRPEVRRLAMEAIKLAEEREELKPFASFVQLYLLETPEEVKTTPYMTKQPESKPLSLLILDRKSSAILSKLSSASSHLECGKINEALLDLYEAVDETINLILEAEGLELRRPDGRRLTMKERFRLLVDRSWVGRGAAYFFARLQALRKRIAKSPESISVDEVKLLLSFHTLFVRTSLRKLKSLNIES